MSKGDGPVIAAGCTIVSIWLLSVAASLGLTAVVIWAIVKLVQHFT